MGFLFLSSFPSYPGGLSLLVRRSGLDTSSSSSLWKIPLPCLFNVCPMFSSTVQLHTPSSALKGRPASLMDLTSG